MKNIKILNNLILYQNTHLDYIKLIFFFGKCIKIYLNI